MKKIYILIVIFGLILMFFITKNSLGNGYKFNDMGFDYWQSILNDKGEVVPVKVVEYDSDDRYIISVRIIIDMYECYDKNTVKFIPENNIALPFISRKKLQYWIIDKQKSIAYISENKINIEQKIKLLNLSLEFDDKDYKDNSYMKGFKSELNPKYKCILTNDPLKNNIKIIDLDK